MHARTQTHTYTHMHARNRTHVLSELCACTGSAVSLCENNPHIMLCNGQVQELSRVEQLRQEFVLAREQTVTMPPLQTLHHVLFFQLPGEMNCIHPSCSQSKGVLTLQSDLNCSPSPPAVHYPFSNLHLPSCHAARP